MISISKLNSHFLKPAITLNLQSEKGQSLLYRLIPHFDVLTRYWPDLIMLSLHWTQNAKRFMPPSTEMTVPVM